MATRKTSVEIDEELLTATRSALATTTVRETIEEFERTYEPAYYRNPTRSDFNIMGADLLLGPQSPNEVKVRHVRDSEYWNAPVGTPLPLPKKPKGKKKKLTEWSAGGGSHPVPPEVEQTLREIYEMTYQHGDTTYRTKIDHTPWAKTYATGSYITVQGVVIINGEPQGRFVRELSLDYAPEYDDDLVQYSPWVHNSMFGIASEYQGQGFAEAFYAHTEERLAEEGFRYEWMEANIDIGGYAWARRGFHFRDRRGRERIGFRIKWLYDNIDKMARTEAQGREPDPEVELNLAEYGGPLDDPVLGTQMFHLANAVLDGTAQPEDVAAFGEDHPEWHWIYQTAGREPIPMWPGKWIMLGTGWNGIRPLAPDGQQKDMRADHMATVRATLAHAEEVYIPGDYYRNPERSDYNIMGADLLAGPIGPQTKGVRHVRDAAYWGAPVGTPLPLGIKPSTVAVEEETDFGYIEEEPPDTQALLTEAQRDYVAQRLIEINGGTMPERYEGHGYGALRPNVYKAVVAHDLAVALDDVSTEDLLNALREPGAASLYPHWYQTVTDPESDELLTLRDNGGFGLVGYEVPRADLFGRMPVKAGTPEAEQRFREFLLSVYVQAWANTSNDHNVLSHCLQNAARRAFDLDEAADWEPSTADGANKFTEIEADIEQMDEDYGDVYEAVVRAQYENTQEFLKDAGIETLIVYRGTRLTQRESNWLDNNGVVVTRPLSSWSTSLVTAYGFQHGVSRKRPVTVQSVVSAKDVFATPATGIGCLDEDEVVLLGRTYDVGLSTPSWMLSKTIGPMPVVNVDNDDLNADWIKTLHWDLPTDPAYYRGTDQLARLANLPAGQAMPDELRMLLALQSHEEELKTLLDGFLAVERKVRHVRDSDYWGAPEGTPLPLPKNTSAVTFRDDREWNAAYDEYNDLPYLDKFTDDELTLTREQYMADRKPTLDPVPQERQEQIREIVDGLAADFPQVLTRNDVDAVQVIFGADRDDELAHAGGHPPKLVLSQNLIGDEKALIERLYNEGHAMPGMIGHSQAVRDEDYQAILRTVLTHEFGHVLDMAARRDAKAYRELLDLTDDTTAQWAPEEDRDRFTGGPRWQMDPLIRRGGSNDTMWGSNFHSMYATEARSEWIAEAFADGYLNGDNASDPGKAVLAYFQKVLG